MSMIYVTTGSRKEALNIGRALVEARLAACANVIDNVTSIFRWQGEIEEEAEAVLILKTRLDLVDEATAKIKGLHSYDCPCVLSYAIAGGNSDFLDWIVKETK
jgi:periplasmic divalent cation tolerance protein